MATISSSRQQPLSMSGAPNTNPLNGSNNNRPPSQRPRLPHVDPSINAEYPIYISDRLKKKKQKQKQKQQESQSSSDSGSPAKASELLAIAYNTKPKATLNTHRVQIFPSSKTPQGTPGTKYKLTIQEKENESQTWIYHGSHDPKTIHEKAQQASGDNRTSANGNGNISGNGSPREKSVVLMYNHDERAFILEEVDTKLNFNMVKNSKEPGASLKERYEQLMVADGSDTSSSNEDGWDEELEDADPSNPYDWRHFAKKAREEELLKLDEKQLRETATPSQASPHSLRPSSSQSNVARLGKSSTPMPEPAKPAAARGQSKGKAAAGAGTAVKSTTSETTTSTAKTKSRTITNPLRQPAKRKPGRPPGSTAAAKANAAKVKSAERMPKDDEPDEDDNGSKAEHEYKDGEVIDLPTFEPPTTLAPKKRGPQKKTGSQNNKKDEVQEGHEIQDYEYEDETHDRRSMPPPPRPSSGNNVEVGESAIDGEPLVIEWNSPERKRSPIHIDQAAAGFGQVDEDDGLEHVGLANIIAKRKEEEQRKRQSAMEMDDEEDEDRDSDADEDDDGDGDGDGNGEDAGADAIEAELLNLFEQSEHQSEQPATKQRDDDESSISEEE
ncbi:hypothetical protein KEM56_002669 [Ascosphaera pollenicola]|nr:hypothetical protein KEM56_002669 [Ascosphaera pollenicola]